MYISRVEQALNSSVFLIALAVLAALVFGWGIYGYFVLSALRREVDKNFIRIHDNIKERNNTALLIFDEVKKRDPASTASVELGMQSRHLLATCAERVRSFSTDPQSMNSLTNAYTAMATHLTNLQASAKAKNHLANFKPLTEHLAAQENNFAFAQQVFNDSVRSYNKQRRLFPCALIATMLGYRRAGLLVTGLVNTR